MRRSPGFYLYIQVTDQCLSDRYFAYSMIFYAVISVLDFIFTFQYSNKPNSTLPELSPVCSVYLHMLSGKADIIL